MSNKPYKIVTLSYFFMLILTNLLIVFLAFEVRHLTGAAKAQSEFILFPILPFLFVSIIWGCVKFKNLFTHKTNIYSAQKNLIFYITTFNFYFPLITPFIALFLLK